MNELGKYMLERYPDSFITGGDDCNLLIWGAEGADRHTPGLCSLVIGLEYDPYALPEERIRGILDKLFSDNLTCRKLFLYGNEFAGKTKLPFAVIVYPSMRGEFEGRWEESGRKYDPERVEFYCVHSGDSIHRGTVSGAALRSVLYAFLNVSYSDNGTAKEKNKTLADYFHVWSRECLTRHIVKFDLDGFLFNEKSGKSALVEFKRSSQAPWIPEWYPQYDKPDYIMQNTFAGMIGAGFWLLHHERRAPLSEGYVSFFDIGDIDESEPEYFLRFRRRAMKLPLHGEGSLDSVIQSFVSSAGTAATDGFCCPLCGSPIRYGQYGFYCSGKLRGSCDMNVGKHYAHVLDEPQLRSLLAGIPVSYRYNDRDIVLSPKVEQAEYMGKTFCRWKRAYRP